MKKRFKQLTKKLILKSLKVDKKKSVEVNNSDFTSFEKEVIKRTANYTMTGPERIVSLIRAVEFIVENNIKGDIVECGVWKGGSIMAALIALKKQEVCKDVYLYDTFEGMVEPTEDDMSNKGKSATDIYQNMNGKWCYSSLNEVKSNIETLQYPKEKIHYIKGKVEETIPNNSTPKDIALLRLDTDWYESTKHEMEHLFPKIVKGGIIIIDDYGHWTGCKKAVDEYLLNNKITLFLSRVDYTCRIGVKL
ncbi:TylF/MycF/NovP-related O-methyltransferase [Algibacter sp. AS12]|uniref:TylF/MycF/NovP-related O-methyltransferase n=1 Tax=Algibacter sp. AS12 TaxID=3135773 RepID=UPI00398B4CE7